MKVAAYNKSSDQEALSRLLCNYRDTPHPATGVTPNEMLFRDPPQSVFPRRSTDPQTIVDARQRDIRLKAERQEQINSGKFRKTSTFTVGDTVLIRNFDRTSKFQPYFQPSPLVVTEVLNSGRCLTLQRLSDGRTYQRHPDDVKLVPYTEISTQPDHETSDAPLDERGCALHLQGQLATPSDDDADETYFSMSDAFPQQGQPQQLQPEQQRPPQLQQLPLQQHQQQLPLQQQHQQLPLQHQQQRPHRNRTRNPRYFNNDVVNH